MGFGHRVYKSYDPRAKIIKRMADLVFDVTGKNPLLEMALELERIALEDEYFVSRKLYPNVDFYSGLIYQAMGFPVDMFPVLFAIPRTAGWIAQWEEMLHRSGSEDRAAAADLPGARAPRLRAARTAEVTMRTAVAAFGVLLACASAQPPAPATPKFDGARAFDDLKAMVALGPRPAGSPALEKNRDYIRKQLTAAGLKVEEQAFDAQTPAGTVHMINLRATLPGRQSGNARIVIGGHYDTKLAKDFPFVGASDAASSAAFLLEIARALKGRENPLPIELVFLDGEEAVKWNWDVNDKDHTYGSRHYVDELKKANAVKDVRAFILVDMIARSGSRHPPRAELHAVADRHRLDYRQASQPA